MDLVILFLFLILVTSLNIIIYILHKHKKVNLVTSGIIMIFLAPIFGFSSGSAFLHFYEWSEGGTGEGAGIGGAVIGLLTFLNGLFILGTGLIKWTLTFIKRK